MTNVADKIMSLDPDCNKLVEMTRVWRVLYTWTRGAGCGRALAWMMATAVLFAVYGKWPWADRLCDVLGEARRRGLKIAGAKKAWVPPRTVEKSWAELEAEMDAA